MPAKGQRRKQQIIDTAKHMFIENGFQSTHIGQVCDKLEIARGTVYQYFGNKREILYAILDNVFEEISDIFDPDDLKDFFDEDPTNESMNGFLFERIKKSITAIISEPIVIKLIFKDIVGIDEEVVDKVEQFITTLGRMVVKDLKDIQSRGLYREDVDPEISANMIIGGGLLLVRRYEKDGKDVLSAETINNTVNFILKGLQ